MAKKKKEPETDDPLSDEELNRFGWRIAVSRQMNGPGYPPDPLERIFTELRAYRSLKRLTVTMDEHHSSMGTSPIAICKDAAGKEHHVGTSFPMYELGFDTKRGQRFLVLVAPLPPDKKMKPRKNPFKEKSRGRRRA